MEQSHNVLQSRRRLWLFSMPRTSSNMFVRMMKGHTNLANVEYEFMHGAFFKTWEKYDLGALSEDEKDWIRKTFDEAFETLVTKVESAESEGKMVFGKEHSTMVLDRRLAHEKIYHNDQKHPTHIGEDPAGDARWTLHMPGEAEVRQRTNISMLPDDFLLSWLPVFLIRHPALVIPSQYRVFKKGITDEPLNHVATPLSATFTWSRMMYDWYLKNGVPAKSHGDDAFQDAWPIILDANDIVHDPRVIEKFCYAAKLDPSEVSYTWFAEDQEAIKKAGMMGTFLGTLMTSTGIKKDLHKDEIDIDAEELKWKEEFGDEIAAKLRQMTDDAMPDYQYLRARRMRADQAEVPN